MMIRIRLMSVVIMMTVIIVLDCEYHDDYDQDDQNSFDDCSNHDYHNQ